MIDVREITADIRIGVLDLEIFSNHNGIALKRDQEKAGALFVLEQLLETKCFDLAYTPENKPYLRNSSSHISISHSHNKLVIILNRKTGTGIDIELIRDKVLRIRDKFLNKHEAAFAGNNVEKLIAIWSAKEAMYKYHGLKELEFKLNISVDDFDTEVILGKIETVEIKKRFKLIREKIDDYVLVYILNETASQ